MTYELEIREHVDRAFRKLAKRDSRQMEAVAKKIEDVAQDPYSYKPLRSPLAGMRRVHVGSFVLVFSIDERRRTVVIEDYEHQDKVYKP